MLMNISKNFTMLDATKSSTAIRLGFSNIPNDTQIECIKKVAENILEPINSKFDFHVTSFFRNLLVNRAIGGATTSQHRLGQAVDIDAKIRGGNSLIATWVIKNLDFDQLIYEFKDDSGDWAWIHISYVSKELNRKSVLIAKKVGKSTIYEKLQ